MRRLLVPLLLVATCLPAWNVAPASADPGAGMGGGDQTGTGFDVWARLAGEYSRKKQANKARYPTPQPICWWAPWEETGNPHDPEAVKRYWYDVKLANWPPGQHTPDLDFDAAIAASKNKEEYPNGVTWYQEQFSAEALDATGLEGTDRAHRKMQECGTWAWGELNGGEMFREFRYDWFRTGEPPAPVMDPRTLAQYGYDVMDLEGPTLEWNPTISNRNSAALVNLPTWLWAEEPAVLVGTDEKGKKVAGKRQVRVILGALEVVVQAQVDTVKITAGGDSTTCTAEQLVKAEYGSGVREKDACTLTFTQASSGGFTVTADVVWSARWWVEGSDQGGDLGTYHAEQTTNIPVVQSQALVTEIR